MRTNKIASAAIAASLILSAALPVFAQQAIPTPTPSPSPGDHGQKRKVERMEKKMEKKEERQEKREGRQEKREEKKVERQEKRTERKTKLAEQKKELEFYSGKTKPPAKITQDIQSTEFDIKAQEDLLAAKKKDVEQINARYDDDKKRYLELTKGGGAARAGK